ncbi:MAG: cytochrome c [Vicinamibacterales bacterium]
MRVHLQRIAGIAMMAGAALAPANAAAQTRTEPNGEYLYRTYCASCHGTSARGDGPLADQMRRRPTDLTDLARSNKGVFPRENVYRVIDGRRPVRGHGGPDMPVWGDIFARTSGVANEGAITARIEALVRYLEGLQARTAN